MGAFGEFFLGKEGKTTSELAFASPEEEAFRKKQLQGIEAGTAGILPALRGQQRAAAGQLQGFQLPQQRAIGRAPTNIPQAQTQFAISGAPANVPQAAATFAAPTLTGPDMSSVTQAQGVLGQQAGQNVIGGAQQQLGGAQQQLAGVMGGLGAFGGGVSAEDMAALDAVQKRALARAGGQIGERLFAGGATTGGAANLGAMAASESAADFARQFAEAQRFGRTQQLEALGMGGQLALGGGQIALGEGQLALGQQGQQIQAAQALGGLGIEQGTLELNRQISQGQLSAEAGRQALEAQGININAAMQAAELAQRGDIAGAELALKGTGMNINSALEAAKINQQADIETGRQRLGAAELDLSKRGQLAGILGQSPELQALNARLAAAGVAAPQVLTSGTGGRTGILPGLVQGGIQGMASGLVGRFL